MKRSVFGRTLIVEELAVLVADAFEPAVKHAGSVDRVATERRVLVRIHALPKHPCGVAFRTPQNPRKHHWPDLVQIDVVDPAVGRAGRRSHLVRSDVVEVPAKNATLLSTFPMFVPSRSWQIDRVCLIKMLQCLQKRVYRTEGLAGLVAAGAAVAAVLAGAAERRPCLTCARPAVSVGTNVPRGAALCETPLSCSVFLAFVPSLSWQIIGQGRK
jgi:hypothetical protein